MKLLLATARGAFALLAVVLPTHAWDYEGHRTVNQLALASLPTNFPAFFRTPAAVERVAFLGGEPDRWRNTSDVPLRHFNGPDHYFDVEDVVAAKLDPKALSHYRYEFTVQFAAARLANLTNFPPLDPATDRDHVKALPGFLPWAITENYAKLKSGFSYLKVFEELGTPDEIANAQQNILYIMGVLGHYVGDAAQPLHTTRHFNGWIGENPKGYSTKSTFHAWIDGGYLAKVGGVKPADLQPKLRPAQLVWPGDAKAKHEDVFPEAMAFILDQFKLMEPLYQMDKDGKLSGEGEAGLEGRAFLAGQLVKAGQMLGDLYFSAWQQAAPDAFLKGALNRRKLNP